MRRVLRQSLPLACVLMLLLSLFSFSTAFAQKKPIVVIGTLNDYPVFFADESGTPAGLAVDLLNRFARANDYEIQYELYPDEVVADIFKTKGDLMYDGGFREGSEISHISIPFYYKNYAVFANKALIEKKGMTINMHAFLEDATKNEYVGAHRTGTLRDEQINKLFYSNTNTTLSNDHELLRQVVSKGLDYAILPIETGQLLVNKYRMKDIDYIKDPLLIEDCSLISNNENSQVLYDLNKFILTIRKNGELNQLTRHWYEVTPNPLLGDNFIVRFNIGIAVILLISIVFAVRSHFLEKILNRKTAEVLASTKENEILFNRLLEEEKLKNACFISISHELRTPISLILNAAQLTEGQLNAETALDEHRLNKYNQIIENNSYRLLRVINNTIDLNRMESNQYSIHTDVIDLVFLLNELISTISEINFFQKVQINLLSSEEELYCQADPKELERVFVNLISNSVKFCALEPEITIKVEQLSDQTLRIIYTDNSIGISRGDFDKVFTKNVQLDNALNKQAQGQGLGLYIAKRIIELHCGTLQLKEGVHNKHHFEITLNKFSCNSASMDYYARPSLYDRKQVIKMEMSEITKVII